MFFSSILQGGGGEGEGGGAMNVINETYKDTCCISTSTVELYICKVLINKVPTESS